jgi:hypothetical protein
MSNNTQRIAELLNVSESTAKVFCLEVQACFTGKVPRYSMILEQLRKTPNAPPREVAHAIQQRTSSRSSRRKRRQRPTRPSPPRRLTNTAFTPPEEPFPEELLTPRYSYKRNTYKPRNRVELDSTDKCPHGVPTFRKCAICDPEGFREETGWG